MTPKKARTTSAEIARLDEEIVELSLLVPNWQVQALEKLAQSQGLTTAQLVRRLIRTACLQQTGPAPRPG